MGVSGQLYTPLLIEEEARWAPEAIWKLRRKEISLSEIDFEDVKWSDGHRNCVRRQFVTRV